MRPDARGPARDNTAAQPGAMWIEGRVAGASRGTPGRSPPGFSPPWRHSRHGSLTRAPGTGNYPPSRQARRLWEHWNRPQMAWYSGGHVGFFWAGQVSRFVEDALAQSGLVVREPETQRSLTSSAEAAEQ